MLEFLLVCLDFLAFSPGCDRSFSFHFRAKLGDTSSPYAKRHFRNVRCAHGATKGSRRKGGPGKVSSRGCTRSKRERKLGETCATGFGCIRDGEKAKAFLSFFGHWSTSAAQASASSRQNKGKIGKKINISAINHSGWLFEVETRVPSFRHTSTVGSSTYKHFARGGRGSNSFDDKVAKRRRCASVYTWFSWGIRSLCFEEVPSSRCRFVEFFFCFPW